MRDLRIVFMGTPEFAVPSLDVLVKNHYQVVGVVTAPDKPKGRGQKLAYSPVKEYALANNLTVFQPTNLKSPDFVQELKNLRVNLQVVVAFRMLPEVVWALPEYGTFNLHASLLPQYRGAAPINWAIINGEKETGATTFFLNQEIDTGAIILKVKESIDDSDNAGSLHDKLMIKGAGLVLETVRMIEKDEVRPLPQDLSKKVKHAPKIHKETCKIDWNKKAEDVFNFVRGLSPYPAAWTEIEGQVYKVYQTRITEETAPELEPGQYSTDNKTFLHLKTADKLISIIEFQKEGKKKMDVESFFRGNTL
jgi:methionyl-tRNA formyltransferase